jgi:hypothetical protein
MRPIQEAVVSVPAIVALTRPAVDAKLLTENGRMRALPAKELAEISHESLMYWCHVRARYVVPSAELIDWLKHQLVGEKGLEICAGMGDLGRLLGIPMTDSYVQIDDPEVNRYYHQLGAAPTDPPPDVEPLSANQAVIQYKPSVVIAGWATQCPRPGEDPNKVGSTPKGTDEEKLWKHPWVKKYIHIGNDNIHNDKRLLKYPHQKLYFPWLFSRQKEPQKNVIYVWTK